MGPRTGTPPGPAGRQQSERWRRTAGGPALAGENRRHLQDDAAAAAGDAAAALLPSGFCCPSWQSPLPSGIPALRGDTILCANLFLELTAESFLYILSKCFIYSKSERPTVTNCVCSHFEDQIQHRCEKAGFWIKIIKIILMFA